MHVGSFWLGTVPAAKVPKLRLLAEHLGWQLIDSDQAAEQRSGRTIADIFATAGDGEAAFRMLESETIAAILQAPEPSVVATGGGCIETEAVRSGLNTARRSGQALVIYLHAPAAVLGERLSHDPGNRPAFDRALIG